MPKQEIIERGVAVSRDALSIDNNRLIVRGRFIRTARAQDEWFSEVANPAGTIKGLKEAKNPPDIFTFTQKVPETEPRYEYYFEHDNVAAIRLTDYDHWWNKQVNGKTRNLVRKAEKKGVVVRRVEFDDGLAAGICEIFNETPIRQDKPFWHYGKDFETVRREMSLEPELSCFIGAYLGDSLVGFIKLLCGDTGARIVQILSKIEHRDRSPTNALIAKAVEVCCEMKMPYLFYEKLDYGKTGSKTLADFKRSNGFEKILLPRYYVPLTVKGRLALMLGLHHELKDILPQTIVLRVIDYKKKMNRKKYLASGPST